MPQTEERPVIQLTPNGQRPHHPVVLDRIRQPNQSLEVRIADSITQFAGSMRFVYAHVALFTVWMLVLEKSPWPTLTLAVSLEAIFLSTFVMISQNRADAKRQVIADQEWRTMQRHRRRPARGRPPEGEVRDPGRRPRPHRARA